MAYSYTLRYATQWLSLPSCVVKITFDDARQFCMFVIGEYWVWNCILEYWHQHTISMLSSSRVGAVRRRREGSIMGAE